MTNNSNKLGGMTHVCCLAVNQWLSMAVVILNMIALHMAHNEPNLKGTLVSSQAGLQDSLLILLGIVSFLAASLPLALYCFISCRRSYQQHQHTSRMVAIPTKMVLVTEMSIGVIMITLWTAAVSIVLTHFHVSSHCRFDALKNVSACQMLDKTIIVGCVSIAGWGLLLIIASISIATSPPIATDFYLETNPYLNSVSTSPSGYPLEAAPTYSSLPPPMENHHDNDSTMSRKKDKQVMEVAYPQDVKYPIYSIDALPMIQVGTSKFDLPYF